MTRILLITAVSLALLLPLAAGAAAADVEAGTNEDPTQLGTVRGDTLLIDRDLLIAAALERNEMLRAGGALVAAADARAAGAWSGFLPRISVNEYFLRSDDALQAFGFRLQNRAVTNQDFDPSRLNQPGEVNNWITSLRLEQPIFNGGMGWNGKAAADAAARSAHFDNVRARETVVLQATEVFEGLNLGLALEDVVEAAIANAEAHERQAQSLLEAEMATEADVLQAEVFLSRLHQQLITVRNRIAMAGEMVRLLTAIETPLVIAAQSPPAAGAIAAPVDTAGVRERSDIRARQLDAEAAGKMQNVATGAMLPHVNLSLQRDYYSHDTIFGSDAKSWGLGVYATWDLFKGLENVSALREAKAQKRAAEYRYQYESRRARHEVQQAARDADAASQRVSVAERAVEAARASLRIVSNQYREGLASMIDLIDVQTAATRAEGDLVQARHDYRVDLARLAHATGHSLPEGEIQ